MAIDWFRKRWKPKPKLESKHFKVPQGLWIKCKGCKEVSYSPEVAKNDWVCPKCHYHFKITAWDRVRLILDEDSWQETDKKIQPCDPLNFKDRVKYKDRLKKYQDETKLTDAVLNFKGTLNGREVILTVMDFQFMGGSMGSVVGEKVTLAAERACKQNIPLIAVTCSGGARMQEGALSLMQMAKISAALSRLHEAAIPYIAVLTDPTFAGVSASFAMLGDIHIAEPGAIIGFTGPRVIAQTIKQDLPEGFQTAEFLLEHGMIDMVLDRRELKKNLSLLLDFMVPLKRRWTAVIEPEMAIVPHVSFIPTILATEETVEVEEVKEQEAET